VVKKGLERNTGEGRPVERISSRSDWSYSGKIELRKKNVVVFANMKYLVLLIMSQDNSWK
jgi:hypothetical protein